MNFIEKNKSRANNRGEPGTQRSRNEGDSVQGRRALQKVEAFPVRVRAIPVHAEMTSSPLPNFMRMMPCVRKSEWSSESTLRPATTNQQYIPPKKRSHPAVTDEDAEETLRAACHPVSPPWQRSESLMRKSAANLRVDDALLDLLDRETNRIFVLLVETRLRDD